MAGRASIKDVALRAGVSAATVSNALNHPERVRPAVLTRVQHAMAELKYVRSEPARHLRSGRSKTIGLLLLDTGNPEFTRMAEGVEDAVSADGWTVLMGSSRRDAQREGRYVRSFLEQRTAGIIVTPRDGIEDALSHVHETDTPVVLLDRSESDPTRFSVSVDDYHGGRLAVQHLHSLGHRTIGFVGTPSAATPVQERFSGVQQGVAECPAEMHLDQYDADLTMAAGREVGHRIARLKRRPTAIIAAIDMLAFGVLQSLMEENIQVPHDISLCGYDDTEFAAQLATPLTSIHRPNYRIGHAAGSMMLDLLAGREPTERHLRYEPELVVRASTGAPAAGRRR